MYLFLDPGVTTGYATLDSKGTVNDWGQVTGVDSFTEKLTMIHRETPLEEIFYERFLIDNEKLFRDKKGGKRKSLLTHLEKVAIQTTMEVIGALKTFCNIFKIKLTEIRDVTLKAAYAHAGLSKLPPSQHKDSHQYDALAYARSYAIRKGLTKVKPRHT